MISLAEKPRKIKQPRGPYNLDGRNKEKPTDDKPFIHTRNGQFYLSWGCFYAMADNVYGPYDYKGSIIEQESFAPGYDAPIWPTGFKQGCHGSFFEWHNQWYFAYCDISQTGNRYFRDTFISYVHYKENGEMALIRVDGIGVGEYDANNGEIEAEDYFDASGISKIEIRSYGFLIDDISNSDYLLYQNIKRLSGKKKFEFKAVPNKDAIVEIRKKSPDGTLLASCNISKKSKGMETFSCDIPSLADEETLCLVFVGKGDDLLRIDSFSFR